MIKIASWNLNSINSRLPILLDYLKSANSPDILLLQELKCTVEAFPYDAIEDLGYNVVVNGQKTYNGVAIISKFALEDVNIILANDKKISEQARYIEAVTNINGKVIRVASVYVPNGQSPESEKFIYKLQFFSKLREHFANLLNYQEILVLGGDFNVAPSLQLDCYDAKNLEGSICCHKDERKEYNSLLNLGLLDAFRIFYPEKQQFTWWDYRGNGWQHNKGLRIDHIILSPEAVDLALDCVVDTSLRELEKPSDHTPIICHLDL